jgi:heme-degrading monooxygenase HmoA
VIHPGVRGRGDGHPRSVPGVASFHLVREPARRAPAAMARLAGDRLRLRGTPGLRFARVLGTGRGSSTAPGADLARTALFAVWESPAELAAFEAGWFGRRLDHVRDRGGEAYAVHLALLSGHGSWGGHDVVRDLRPGRDRGPVAVLTRARVARGARRTFRAAARSTAPHVVRAEGLLAVVGIGELPTGLLGTFSLWADAAAPSRFAFRGPEHREVVRRARAEGWYGEELFARFEPVRSCGTWDGRDPLGGSDRRPAAPDLRR